jgi:hypothetical protein
MKNKNIYRSVGTICLILVMLKTVAQTDPHFTQNYTYPMYVNPALAGSSDGEYRASAIYRSQWGSISDPYRTMGISFDTRTNKNIALGVNLLNQSAGDGGFNYLNTYASFAYTGVKFGKENNHRIVLALQAGMINRAWMNRNSNGANNGTRSPDITHQIQLLKPSPQRQRPRGYGRRCIIFRCNSKQKNKCLWRLFCFSYNKPKDPIISTQNTELNTIPLRYVVHGGLSFNLFERTSIVPHVLYMRQGTASEMMFGTYVPIICQS